MLNLKTISFMKCKSEVNIQNAKIGMRIKVALPRAWCQVNHTSHIVWLKGKIIDINYSKKDNTKISGITFNCKWKKHHYYFKIDRVWAPADNGVFTNIYKCK